MVEMASSSSEALLSLWLLDLVVVVRRLLLLAFDKSSADETLRTPFLGAFSE